MTRMRVKICGITRPEDAQLAARLGADAIGFVLWERSPRRISVADAAAIAKELPPFITRVGVVVDMSADDVGRAVRAIGLDAIQLHGDENPLLYAGVPARLIKVVAPETDADFASALAVPPQVTLLVDAADREARGGTGRRADWSRAADLARARRVVLSGGLTPENVAAAVAQVRPWAVDVSSGVEDRPGVKSVSRMAAFFEAISGSVSSEVL
jgi:phosphoribosylanthranilate isomerase